MITLDVYDKSDNLLSHDSSDTLAQLDVRYRDYEPGDYIVLSSNNLPLEVELMIDASLAPSIVYMTQPTFRFDIPFNKEREPYGQHAFTGDCHWGYARALSDKEKSNYRCLSQNSADLEHAQGFYPHASTDSGATNVRFLARNAIDGVIQTIHHGRWPYESFGMNGKPDAYLRVDLGREVSAEDLIVYLRCDFPHDAWWQSARLTLSDGTTQMLHFEKRRDGQCFYIGPHTISWFMLDRFQKADDPSPWAALSQVQLMGHLI